MNGQVMRETKPHGDPTFPYTVYKSIIPQYLDCFPLHWHDEAEIIYVRRGTGTVTVENRKHTVCADDIIIIMPQTVHAIDRLQTEEMEYFNILFSFALLDNGLHDRCYEKYLKPLYDHTRLAPELVSPRTRLHDELVPSIRYLIDNRHEYADDELMIKSKLFDITDRINKNSTTASPEALSLGNNYDKLKNLLAYIRSDYGDDITVEKAASLCSYSPSHFMKLFKELTGKSFTRYLIDYRLDTAANRLRRTSDKITDIAVDAGFNSMSYFSRTFFAAYGCTPSEYRTREHTR